MTTPVIMTFALKFPEARITVVAGPKAQSLLSRSKYIHKLVVYDKKGDLFSQWRFLKELRKTRYEIVVDLRNTAIPFLVSCKKRSPLFRRFHYVNKRENHLEVVQMMGFGLDKVDPFDFFDEEDENQLFKKLEKNGISDKKNWILVAPGAASERKRWPAEHFQALIRKLIEFAGKQVLLIGAENEKTIAEAVAQKMSPAVHVLCGQTTISETAALISKASLVVANDSAVMHLGFELGAPTVGIFGPTDHEKYGHHGRSFRIAREDAAACSCHSSELPYAQRSCFHGLKPEKVFDLCKELLYENKNS